MATVFSRVPPAVWINITPNEPVRNQTTGEEHIVSVQDNGPVVVVKGGVAIVICRTCCID